jgi:hypothetical protein
MIIFQSDQTDEGDHAFISIEENQDDDEDGELI